MTAVVRGVNPRLGTSPEADCTCPRKTRTTDNLDLTFLTVDIDHLKEVNDRYHTFDLGDGQSLHRTCSIGFASYPFFPQDLDRLNWEEVVNLADECLYAAKQSGRNAWVGVQSTATKPGEDFNARARHGLAPLVEEGTLRIDTSLKDLADLLWE